jgi:hypothetical protein
MISRLHVTMTTFVEILVTKSFGTNITLNQSQLYHTLHRNLVAKYSKVMCLPPEGKKTCSIFLLKMKLY